jgi:hypothetical protein
MAHLQSSNPTLLVSLLTLTAATAVTVVALTAWTGEISERLTGQSAIADELPENIVIGGVEGANTYGATSTAPSPVYRPADERLPSQTADQAMAQLPDEACPKPYQTPPILSPKRPRIFGWTDCHMVQQPMGLLWRLRPLPHPMLSANRRRFWRKCDRLTRLAKVASDIRLQI